MSFRRNILAAVALTASLFAVSASAEGWSQLGPKTSYTVEQVADAIRKSPLNENLKRYATAIGEEAMAETAGNAGVYNGTCCSGILGLNRGFLSLHGLTPKDYVQLSLQEQIDLWARYANKHAVHPKLKALIAARPNDGEAVVRCIQMGPGNCANDNSAKAGKI